MNAQKIEVCIFELGRLIGERNKINNRELWEHGTKLIIAKAQELIDVVNTGNCKDKSASRVAQAQKAFEDFLEAMSKIS